ncbi:hypothetical protein GY45DRAFT_1257881, partial [Cubamyces sp. BRFM 1775]
LIHVYANKFPSFLSRLKHGYEQVYQQARLMPRILGAYIKIERAFVRGGTLVVTPGYMDTCDPAKEYDVDVENVRAYIVLQEHFLQLIHCEDYLHDNPDVGIKVLDYIDKVAARARGDDLSRLRNRVIIFTAPEWLPHLKVKNNRGFKNVITGRLLCPITKLTEFDEDPEGFCRAVRDGRTKITSRDWPLFLYDEGLVVKGKIKPGLLRSPFLVQCFKVVFTGPQSAEDDVLETSKSTGKPSLSQKYNITAVTMEMILYVASLVRSLLSSQAGWAVKDGFFNGPQFVRSLMRSFARHSEWCSRTLDWWNDQVYKHSDEEACDGQQAADLMDMEDEDEYDGVLMESASPTRKMSVRLHVRSDSPEDDLPDDIRDDGDRDNAPIPDDELDAANEESDNGGGRD